MKNINFKRLEKQADENITSIFNPEGTEKAKRDKQAKEILRSIFNDD